MHVFRNKITAWYHHIKSSRRLSLLALILLFAAIPTTVFLAQKAADIRQHADSYAATITVNPTTAKPGETLTVGWTIGKTSSSLFPKAYAQAYLIGGTISASPNPCTLSAAGTCTSTITWRYTMQGGDKATPQSIQVRLKEANGVVFAQNASGSQDAPWITATPLTFELYADNTLLDSVTVRGVDANGNHAVTNTEEITPTIAVSSNQTVTPQAGTSTTGIITGAESLQLINTNTGAVAGPKMYMNCITVTAGTNGTVAIPASSVLSGQCPYVLPATLPTGTYTFRMVAADGTSILGNSSAIAVTAPTTMSIPIYRLVNTSGTTFFWADAAQKDAMLTQTFNGQKVWDQNPVIAFYASPATQPGAVPIYRLVNTAGTSFFWADAAQKDAMLAQTFNGQKVWDQNPVIAFYATSANQAGAFPIYRLINATGTAFFWANAAQKDAMLTQTFNGQKVWNQNPVIAFYAYTAPTIPTDIYTLTPIPSNRPIPNATRDDQNRYNGYGVEATSTPAAQ